MCANPYQWNMQDNCSYYRNGNNARAGALALALFFCVNLSGKQQAFLMEKQRCQREGIKKPAFFCNGQVSPGNKMSFQTPLLSLLCFFIAFKKQAGMLVKRTSK